MRRYQRRFNLPICAFDIALRKFLCYMVNRRKIEANLEKIKALIEIRSPQNSKEV